MKVSDLRRFLDGRSDNEHLCVLIYEKSAYEFLEDEDLTLTDEGWERLVNDFDETPFYDVSQWVADASIDYADLKLI